MSICNTAGSPFPTIVRLSKVPLLKCLSEVCSQLEAANAEFNSGFILRIKINPDNTKRIIIKIEHILDL
jgi:hypothetical protein